MLLTLRFLFGAILAGMLATITWASRECALFAIPRDVFTHPWFIATLFDAYFAFIAFGVWIAWKEQRAAAGALWFVALLLWGNVAIAVYMLIELFRIREAGRLGEVFTARRPGRLALPGAFVIFGVAVYLLGARTLFE